MSKEEKVNILMVDDQIGKLLSYEAILADLGENLIKANSAREALDHLLRTEIAVVLLDVSMPELDGFDLAEMIRQHPRFQKTPIIFISAILLTDMDRLKGYQHGAVDYISVPINPELLRAKVIVFVDLHRKTRQLELLNLELRRLSNSLIAAQDDERRRIARDLHDGLGQELSGAKMMVDGMLRKDQSIEWREKAAVEASTLIGHALQQVRSISHLLHPPLLDEVGLHSAIQWYLQGLTSRSGLKTEIQVDPEEFPRLGPEVETAIFRIVQEALTNVFRHAEASKGWVNLEIRGNHISVTVGDDGKGVSDHVAQFKPDKIGVGIGGMRQRIKEFGGELRLRKGNPGTLVEITIPLKSASLRPAEPESVAAPQASES
ncbi:MAG TPA: response regulator [Candidatus Acidoferrum sp.]